MVICKCQSDGGRGRHGGVSSERQSDSVATRKSLFNADYKRHGIVLLPSLFIFLSKLITLHQEEEEKGGDERREVKKGRKNSLNKTGEIKLTDTYIRRGRSFAL